MDVAIPRLPWLLLTCVCAHQQVSTFICSLNACLFLSSDVDSLAENSNTCQPQTQPPHEILFFAWFIEQFTSLSLTYDFCFSLGWRGRAQRRLSCFTARVSVRRYLAFLWFLHPTYSPIEPIYLRMHKENETMNFSSYLTELHNM